MSTLGFALLSLLTRGPATGYQLTSRMKAPIGHFWVANHSQIYPELAKLTAHEWVTVEEGSGPGPRAKKTYTITAAGRAALAQWLPREPAFTPRSEVTLKAYAVNAADRTAMAELYQGVADQAALAVAGFEREAAELLAEGADEVDHPRFGNYAVLQMGIESQRALLTWAQWLASRLGSLQS